MALCYFVCTLCKVSCSLFPLGDIIGILVGVFVPMLVIVGVVAAVFVVLYLRLKTKPQKQDHTDYDSREDINLIEEN